MPTGGAKIRRWTLRENRSRYETEAHAFRRWVLSLVRYSEHWKASWMLTLAPLLAPNDLWRGVQAAALLYLVSPLYAPYVLHCYRHLGGFRHILRLTRIYPFNQLRHSLPKTTIWFTTHRRIHPKPDSRCRFDPFSIKFPHHCSLHGHPISNVSAEYMGLLRFLLRRGCGWVYRFYLLF